MITFPTESRPETAEITPEIGGLRAATLTTHPDACLGGAARICWLLVAGLRSGRLAAGQRHAARAALARLLPAVAEADAALIWRQFFGEPARPAPLFHGPRRLGHRQLPASHRGDTGTRLLAAVDAVLRAAAASAPGHEAVVDAGLRRAG